jgi:hypothetical protein
LASDLFSFLLASFRTRGHLIDEMRAEAEIVAKPQHRGNNIAIRCWGRYPGFHQIPPGSIATRGRVRHLQRSRTEAQLAPMLHALPKTGVMNSARMK